MKKTDPFYYFLEELTVNKDGSFDYNIKNRILEKYKKKTKLKALFSRNLRINIPEGREAA